MSTVTERIEISAGILKGSHKKNVKLITDALLEMGIGKDDIDILTSEDFVFGDARNSFCDKRGVPITLFRKIYKILHGKNEFVSTPVEPSISNGVIDAITTMAASMRPIGSWRDEELLKEYSPDCQPRIVDELIHRVGNKRCIAFKSDKKTPEINVSLKMMKEARTRDEMPAHFTTDKTYHLYPIGCFPEVVYDVCPVSGELMIDDYSSKLGIHWTDVDLACRQFIALMVAQGNKINTMNIGPILNLCKEQKLDGLREKFPQITPTFDDLFDVGDLPSLKSKSPKSDQRVDVKPFETKINYRFKQH